MSFAKNRHDLLELFIKELEDQSLIAEKDLGEAALNAPMHGILHCIRSVMQNQDPGQDITDHLFNLGLKISKIIAPILVSDSPEGYLVESKAKISAQILLLCSWRTSKEISLLFGLHCKFVTEDKLFSMSKFFTDQLAEIKHRGAFEQAYVGFCSLCSFMWSNAKYKNVPVKLLEDTLEGLEKSNKFCNTRRSAGVPYLIQAVVSTEPSLSNHSSLKLTLDRLIKLCKDSRDEVRIHAYNILRILFRDSSLGEVVSPFVSDGLKAAILGFKASSWPVR